MKIAFVTLGCKLNYAETSTYERQFVKAGLEVVPWKEAADLYLVNTCTVTETSNAKSRNEIRKLHRINPEARIIVTGCYAQMKPEEVRGIEGVWKVFGSAGKATLVEDCLSELGLPVEGEVPKVADSGSVFGAYSSGERTRSFLKVQDGCDNFCAYCTVPYARGRSRSVPLCEAVRMAREIASQGVREIVITGVNTGDYGRGSLAGESFLDLLKALNGVEGIERYRISSIEPNLLTEETIDWIASGTKFQPHFHIPLQTGSDALLSRMGRKYSCAEFASKLEYIRKRFEHPGAPKVFFGLDVMVGLPGETEELFETTRSFLEKIRPAFIHIFPYSKRPGTPAAEMEGQVSAEEKARRVKVLEELCARLHSEFEQAHKGMKLKVLFESSVKGGMMSGYSQNYIRVSRPADPDLFGKIVEIEY